MWGYVRSALVLARQLHLQMSDVFVGTRQSTSCYEPSVNNCVSVADSNRFALKQKKEKTTGRVEEVPKHTTRFIVNYLRGRIVTTHPDGHCVRRAIGKKWNLHPGQVIQYLATK